MIICTCCSKSMKSHKIGVAVLEMDDNLWLRGMSLACGLRTNRTSSH